MNFRILSGDRIRFHKNRLKIIGSGASDNGVYSCKARNTAGLIESSQNFLLNIPGRCWLTWLILIINYLSPLAPNTIITQPTSTTSVTPYFYFVFLFLGLYLL